MRNLPAPPPPVRRGSVEGPHCAACTTTFRETRASADRRGSPSQFPSRYSVHAPASVCCASVGASSRPRVATRVVERPEGVRAGWLRCRRCGAGRGVGVRARGVSTRFSASARFNGVLSTNPSMPPSTRYDSSLSATTSGGPYATVLSFSVSCRRVGAVAWISSSNRCAHPAMPLLRCFAWEVARPQRDVEAFGHGARTAEE